MLTYAICIFYCLSPRIDSECQNHKPISKDIERSALCITLGLEIAIKSNLFYFYHLKIHVTRESATSSLWEWKTSSINRIWFRVRIVQISCLCLNSNHNMSGGHFQWFWQMQSHIFISFHFIKAADVAAFYHMFFWLHGRGESFLGQSYDILYFKEKKG